MSEIRVDTISEKTSANGVAVDGVTLKDGGVTATAASTITVADNSDTLTLVSTDADGNQGPILNFKRDSSSPADDDILGQLTFTGENSASEAIEFVRIRAGMADVTDGTEDSRYTITTFTGGSQFGRLNIEPTETIFNENSTDVDFRVESNGNANMIFVDGGNDHVNVGTSTDHGGVLNVESTDNAITLLLASTDTDANAGPQLKLLRAVTGADNDICGKIEFGAKDDAGNGEAYALITQKILTAANGSEEGRLTFQVMEGGSQRDMLSLDASEVIINEDSRDIDFRVESNGATHMLFVDGGNNGVFVNTDNSAGLISGASFGVQGGVTFLQTGNSDNLTLLTTDADENIGPVLRAKRVSSSAADNDELFNLILTASNDAQEDTDYAKIKYLIKDASNGTEDAQIDIQVMQAGSLRSRMKSDNAETVFNEDSVDIDFRVESNDLSHMVFVNAASNEIGLGSGNDYSARVLAHQSAADHQALNVEGQNSSYASTALNVGVTRNSSNAYNFIKCEARGFANKFIVRDDGVISAINTTVQSISDIRIKQDITEANSQWDDIKALKFKNFRKKTAVRNEGDDALKELGVIAQDVEAAGMTGLIDYADPDTGNVLDDATFGTLYTQADEDAGNIPSGHFVHEVKEVKEQVKMVKYSIIWMKAMKALQEAQTRIETLETKVAALEG